MEVKQSSPAVTDSALRLPGAPPDLPAEVVERFPSLGTWMDEQRQWWSQAHNAVDDFARAVLDVTEIAGVLIVDGGNSSLYIKSGRGAGAYADPDTPFYVDRAGFFSLKSKLTWDPTTNTLTVDGTIIAGSGVIGGWDINPTTLSKNNAVLDSAGQLALGTGNDIVIISATDATYRLWAGNATAGTATFSVTKAGALFSTAGTIGGFSIGTDYLRDTGNSMGLASTVTGGDDVRFWAGDTFANRASAPFRVTESGALFASNATISGSITATSGAIGGFNVGSDYIRDAANSMGLASTVTGGDDVRFWAGDTFANRATAPFNITESGLITARAGAYIGMTKETTGGVATLSQINGPVELFAFGSGGASSGNIFARLVGGTQAAKSEAVSGSNFGMNGRGWDGAAYQDFGRFSITMQANASVNRSSLFSLYTKNTSNQNQYLEFNQDGKLALANTGSGPSFFTGRINIDNAGTTAADGIYFGSDVTLYRSAADTLKTDDAFACDSLAVTNAVSAASFSGSGASLTALNASNITSGALDNARLPSAISVGSLTASGQIRGATARFGTFTAAAGEVFAGTIAFTDDGGTARKLAVFA